MPREKTKTRAQVVNDYARRNYDDIRLQVPKGEKEKIRTHAQERGETLGGFIKRAISAQIERDRETEGK